MTTPIHAQVIDRFNDDKWSVLAVTVDGTMPVQTKDGDVELPYRAGDVLLADQQDNLICGPLSLAGAIDLAERVLDCNMRVRTDPRTLLCLATALVALPISGLLPPPEAPPAAAELARVPA